MKAAVSGHHRVLIVGLGPVGLSGKISHNVLRVADWQPPKSALP